MKIYANTYKGEKRSRGSFGSSGNPVCMIKTKIKDGVTLVYADVISESALDPDFAVGIDIEASGNFVAIKKSGEFWCRPVFGKTAAEVPSETQLLIFETEGKFTVVLPFVGKEYRCTLSGKSEETVTAEISSGVSNLPTCKTLAFATAKGDNPKKLISDCLSASLSEYGSDIPLRESRKYPEVFEYLGWCSWDAMQIWVNRDGILEKCREFKEKEIPVRWILLDDMWATVRDFEGREYSSFSEMCRLMHASALYDFEADPTRFPGGLERTLSDVKKLGFSAGIWYPTTGYWRGIEKDSPAYDALREYLIETDDGIFVPSPKYEKCLSYFDTVNSFLKNSGADFIKVDNQSMYNRFYRRLLPIGKAARNLHGAIEDSAEKYFDQNIINCMGMSSEDMFSRKKSSVSRTSGDFLPENRDWFKKHIMQCAYNSLLQGEFHVCDWDMWWTDDSQAKRNSIARAVSGGPIYISDKIGRSKKELLAPLIFEDGKIIRCDRPATPTDDCIAVDSTVSGKPIKIQNTVKGSGVLALFNLSKDNTPAEGFISPADIDRIEGEEFAVYSHFERSFRIMKKDERFPVKLDDNDSFALYLIVPYNNGFAPIGNPEKFISPGTVLSASDGEILLYEPGPCAYIKDGLLIIK